VASPRAPLGAGWLISAFIAAYVVVIGVPFPRAALPTASSNSTPSLSDKLDAKASASPRPLTTTQTLKLQLESGYDQGTLIATFPKGTKDALVIATLGPLGFSVVSGESATGRYVLAVPKIKAYVEPRASDDAKGDRAWIHFPAIYSEDEITGYLGRNHLVLERWTQDPETGERVAVVSIPSLEATLEDPERGYYRVSLPGADEATLGEWATSSGVRV